MEIALDTPARRLRYARMMRYRSAADAATALGVPYPTYSQHENGDRNLTVAAAQRYAEAFGTAVEWLLEGRGRAPDGPALTPTEGNKSFFKRVTRMAGGPMIETFGRIPVFGMGSAGDNGRFLMNGQKIAEVFRPPILEGVPDAYAAYVHGDSMFPRYESGETVWLNPHLPPRRDDYVLVQIKTEHPAEFDGYIKRYKSFGDELLLDQFNPAKDLRFPREQVESIHKIVFAGMS